MGEKCWKEVHTLPSEAWQYSLSPSGRAIVQRVIVMKNTGSGTRVDVTSRSGILTSSKCLWTRSFSPLDLNFLIYTMNRFNDLICALLILGIVYFGEMDGWMDGWITEN